MIICKQVNKTINRDEALDFIDLAEIRTCAIPCRMINLMTLTIRPPLFYQH